MKLTAQLDLDVVALDVDDTVTVMLDLEAPAAFAHRESRASAALQIVLDRSGSMAGPPLEGAKQALISLVRRLSASDRFGLVAFDNEAQVVVPAGPVADKEAIIAQIGRVSAGGSTDLGAGLLRGLRELKRSATAGGTLLIVSDGHVNAGLRDVGDFAGVATKARADGIVVSTLGYGEHYDETLLAALAKSGSGNHVFASDPDAAGAAIAGEVEGLLSKAVQAVTVTIALEPAVEMVRLYNDLPCQTLPNDRIMVEVGDLYAEEKRRLLLSLKVPGMSTLGPATIASLGVEYVELPALIEHTARLPIAVNIVPGSESARRMARPVVESERLFQEAQHAKRRASEAFEHDQVVAAREHLSAAKRHLARALEIAPPNAAGDIQSELTALDEMGQMALHRSSQYMSKLSRASYHEMNRKRGRSHGADDGSPKRR